MVTWKSAPHLILRTESGSRYLPLSGNNCWTFGRSDDNQITLPDRWVSRAHAMVQQTDLGEFYLIDLGSRNGTFVNGRRVSVPVRLNNGDRVTLGQTELTFYSPTKTAPDPDDTDTEDSGATAVLSVRRLISVMVVDIRDFTVLTRQLDERMLSEIIGTWFRRAGNIIREAGSWVDKYIGDAVMAVWFHSAPEIGQEGVSKEEVLRICQALGELHHMTRELSDRYPLPFPLRIGAGVNTGYAMVGNTGTGDRPDYTALGDTVNAAFRLESATKELHKDVALGETTYHYLSAIKASRDLFEEHRVILKGYDRPTLTYAGSFDDLDSFVRVSYQEIEV
ncbi:adenylate cyclase [Leptolyngbya valderiana BDU 20041]|uniref:adenylate/guanylate cyclase domain-containing protein n=1 Tax=Baaleninema simplex TaxID=2862350 RepID=UPI000346BCCD|nr:adenylate/guanylate cyclase domain-containing protein [Baaleninema simplex]MDC0833181.1 adenylate/guanylate cyclase domain-containing protein [Geitlerinema sp. CS-897]OAB61055.1 adenylate cyclase [Leptolyngbya valderiana BDU 20041]PPT06828.1 Adenylate cyclase [Geitlerinema sp. FC II]